MGDKNRVACKRDEKCNAKNCKAYCANKILGIVIIILLLNNSIINKIITKTVAIKSII